jgi:uncharacterized membrane protein YccC
MIAFTGVAPKDVIVPRGYNTILGGLVGLGAYAVWPTWERTRVGLTMARLLDAYREYFAAVVEELTRTDGTPSTRRAEKARLAARLARTNAVASVDRVRAEPWTGADEAALLVGILASSHRFAHGVMSVEAGALPQSRPQARPEFRTLAADVITTLEGLAAELQWEGPPVQRWPDLREDHGCLIHNPVAAEEKYALVNVEADRMVNSLNTLREQVQAWRRLRQPAKSSDHEIEKRP